MAHTFHGHHIPGTVGKDSLAGPPISCGGIHFCPRCRSEAKEYMEMEERTHVPMNVPDDFPAKAKKILTSYIDSQYSTEFEKPAFEVYVVWFVKVLQHWKALVSTDRPDGKYYELTYNGDKRETYVDEYTKTKNTVIPD